MDRSGLLRVLIGFDVGSGDPEPYAWDVVMSTDDKSGPPIGSELRERAIRRNIAIQRWMEGQGTKIKAARPRAVYAACLLMALERCGRSDWKILSAEQIDICEQRALSQARVRMFGPKLPPSNEDWDSQIAQVRSAWASPQQEAA